MNLQETVLPLLRETRKLSLPYWGNIESKQKDDTPVNVVTEIDFEIEKFVSAQLKKLYPFIPFVGEENGGNRAVKKFWLMDPIDGTAHFVRGLPFCTTMLALIDEDKVIFGAIYDFISDKMYWAEKGKGAFCDDKRLRVSDRSLKEAYLCWESRLESTEDKEFLLKLSKESVLFRSITAGWEFAMIACGKLDGRICFQPYGKDYDYAPGSLLVEEAGGVVVNLGDKMFDYRNTNFIAGNPKIYKELNQLGNFSGSSFKAKSENIP